MGQTGKCRAGGPKVLGKGAVLIKFYVVVSDGKLKEGTTQEISNNINGFGATTQEIAATTQEIETTTQKITREITDKIIRLIEENPKLGRRAMAELVGISEDGVKYHLKILKKEGKIIHIGPNKKGYWKITPPSS